jgi:hypothetical protein
MPTKSESGYLYVCRPHKQQMISSSKTLHFLFHQLSYHISKISRGAYTRMPMMHPLIRIVQQVEARYNQQTGGDLLLRITMAESHYRTSCE